MEVMRVTSSSNQEVMQKCLLGGKNLLFGLDSPYIQTEKSSLIVSHLVCNVGAKCLSVTLKQTLNDITVMAFFATLHLTLT